MYNLEYHSHITFKKKKTLFVIRFVLLVVLGHFEWVFDGFGSFHIVATMYSQDKCSSSK